MWILIDAQRSTLDFIAFCETTLKMGTSCLSISILGIVDDKSKWWIFTRTYSQFVWNFVLGDDLKSDNNELFDQSEFVFLNARHKNFLNVYDNNKLI